MSGSTGQIVGTVVGAVLGYFTGGASYILMGAALGGAVGGAIDPPKGPHIEGPRLNDLSVQTATYGAVIPRVYGTVALMGNIFWLENNQLQERSKTESQGGKGGGGGAESTTYSYYATFAVGLCEGPIAGVRRIWVGSKLIYDAGSDDISTIIASNASGELFTVHNGAEDQSPDDRMQATLGVSNTPAYRGLAYVVFKDYPLAEHGNSLLGAQVKVEVVKSQTSSVSLMATSPSIATTVGHPYAGLTPEMDRLYYFNQASSASPINFKVMSVDLVVGSSSAFDQTLASSASNNSGGPTYSIDGYVSTHFDGVDFFGITEDSYYGNYCLFKNGAWQAELRIEFVYGGSENYAEGSYYPAYGGLHWYHKGNAYIGHVTKESSSRNWNRLTKYSLGSVDWVFPSAAALNVGSFSGDLFRMYLSPSDEIIYITNNAKEFKQYDLDLNLVSSETLSWLPANYHGIAVSNGKIYIAEASRIAQYDLSTGSLLKQYAVTTAYYPVRIMPIGDLVYFQNGNFVYCLNFADMSALSVTLASIVSAESLTSQIIDASDIDVSGLTQPVRGYRVASVAAIRSAIEPLQGAWPFDALQSGYKIKFKPRGGAVVATVPAIDLDSREAGKASGVSITVGREMDSILPARVILKHIDVNREYDQGEQYAERLNTSAVNISTVEMPIVMTAGEAAANVEMLLYLYWLERYDLSFSLPPTYNGLEPADVITINATTASYELRLTAINYTSDGRLECTAKYNAAAIYSPTALGEEGLSTGAVLSLTGGTAYELLDIPLLLDTTDLPGFPVAMTGYLAGWPGGTVFRSDDAGQTWGNLQTFVAPGAAMGGAGTALGAGRLGMFDQAAALSVSLINGALSSVNEAALLNGANHFAYGAHGRWEIIAAKTCTLQGDGSYVLTDLLRGRFGSEHACASHVTGDSIVLLDSNKLAFVTANLNTIGASRTYRGITAGKDLTTDSDRAFTYTGVNLECLAPVYLNGNRHPSTNDWSLDWIRRTRIGGEWRDYVDATLGETTQAYEVEIYSSAAYTTLKRTITGLTTPAATYTSAQQVTDFGSNQATLYVKIYQLSANVGRGYPLTTSITR